jgi:dTDP-4-amino-4,6-dideoxygalactose transaminase
MLANALGGGRVLLTTSCTHALDMSALLLDIGPADEVILPSFTFVSTANAFALRGARPIFADIRPDTLNIDESQVRELVGPRTKAIVAMHYAGVACELDTLAEIAADGGAALVEDNAHGLFGTYKGRPLGSVGSLAAQSFHETKNITCGEGGALVVNRPELVDRAEIVREKGTNRSRYFRGEVEKYTWVDFGSSYVPSEIVAAFLEAQLEACDRIQNARRRVWERYAADLAPWATLNGTRLPIVPEVCEHPYHLFYLLLPSLGARTRLIEHLRRRRILAVFHYLPLNRSPMGQQLVPDALPCPVAEDVADRLLRLPLYNDMTVDELDLVVEAVTEFAA